MVTSNMAAEVRFTSENVRILNSMHLLELGATDPQNSNIYFHIFGVALFNDVSCDLPLCFFPPEIGWNSGSTYNE